MIRFLLAAVLLLPSPLLAQSAHPAVVADPPRDAAHPARNRQLLIPSKGFGMNALFVLAAGKGPKPTVLLLHGLPGNERNLDLAQAIRRAGWNVLTFTYRGAWGSQGTFSIQHALADTSAAVEFLRSPAASDYNVDPRRIVVIGHSMGGFAAAFHGAKDSALLGVGLLDAWDIGKDADALKAGGDKARVNYIAGFDDLGHALGVITAEDLTNRLILSGHEWHLAPLAPGLARLPVLSIYARHGNLSENSAFAAALRRQPQARVTAVEIDSDHSFADARIRLASEVVRWLDALPGAR